MASNDPYITPVKREAIDKVFSGDPKTLLVLASVVVAFIFFVKWALK
jgi:hypothetical protein